jgi:hypothetical protein
MPLLPSRRLVNSALCLKKQGEHMRRDSSSKEDNWDDDDDDDEDEDYTYVAPPSGRLVVKRKGRSITRKIPKPIVLVDTREQWPFEFTNVPNWIEHTKNKKLADGDYSIEGMEDQIALEILQHILLNQRCFFHLKATERNIGSGAEFLSLPVY